MTVVVGNQTCGDLVPVCGGNVCGSVTPYSHRYPWLYTVQCGAPLVGQYVGVLVTQPPEQYSQLQLCHITLK